VISDPFSCTFDPRSVVGTTTACGETITAQDAAVVKKIIDGARSTGGDFLWYGLQWGAPFAGDFPGTGLANMATVGSTLVGAPFPLILEHMGTWVQENPPVPARTWDWTTTTYEQFDQLFQQSVEMYGAISGTDNPGVTRCGFGPGPQPETALNRSTLDDEPAYYRAKLGSNNVSERRHRARWRRL